VKINDKHIEVIIRQMLRKVEVVETGDTAFLRGEQMDRARVLEANEKVTKEGKLPTIVDPILLASPRRPWPPESFISAASFQETTRVLTRRRCAGMKDDLRGLKENVIVGRLIPAGTGSFYHLARRRRPETCWPKASWRPRPRRRRAISAQLRRTRR